MADSNGQATSDSSLTTIMTGSQKVSSPQKSLEMGAIYGQGLLSSAKLLSSSSAPDFRRRQTGMPAMEITSTTLPHHVNIRLAPNKFAVIGTLPFPRAANVKQGACCAADPQPNIFSRIPLKDEIYPTKLKKLARTNAVFPW